MSTKTVLIQGKEYTATKQESFRGHGDKVFLDEDEAIHDIIYADLIKLWTDDSAANEPSFADLFNMIQRRPATFKAIVAYAEYLDRYHKGLV